MEIVTFDGLVSYTHTHRHTHTQTHTHTDKGEQKKKKPGNEINALKLWEEESNLHERSRERDAGVSLGRRKLRLGANNWRRSGLRRPSPARRASRRLYLAIRSGLFGAFRLFPSDSLLFSLCFFPPFFLVALGLIPTQFIARWRRIAKRAPR